MLTPLCGLATRPLRTLIGGDVAENLGDALWAMLVYWLIVMLRPQLAIGRAASVAMFISAAVEFSQLCHAPWLDTIRRNPLGGLIPGWGFSWGSPMRAESPFAASWISG